MNEEHKKPSDWPPVGRSKENQYTALFRLICSFFSSVFFFSGIITTRIAIVATATGSTDWHWWNQRMKTSNRKCKRMSWRPRLLGFWRKHRLKKLWRMMWKVKDLNYSQLCKGNKSYKILKKIILFCELYCSTNDLIALQDFQCWWRLGGGVATVATLLHFDTALASLLTLIKFNLFTHFIPLI